MKFLFWFETSK